MNSTVIPRVFHLGSLGLCAALVAALAACASGSTASAPPAEVAAPASEESVASSAATTATAAEPAPTSVTPAEAVDDGLGGRLIDRFYDMEMFAPDDKKTPGKADGKGGPFENGTLALVDGKALLNDGGHDYRLKSFFGWDLRGVEGISGPKYQNKKDVQPFSLLATTKSPAELTAILTKGEGTLPAYGSVLSAADIEAIVGFVSKVRDGRLPGPERIWTLSEGTPGNYRLNEGADAERGKKLFADRCSACHGDDGTEILFDGGEYSLGTHSRQKAYEDWFKILNGQPGTKMKRFVKGDAQTMGAEILDILAALCDTKAFPRGKATGKDVAPGDPRCGSYLK